MAKTKQQKTEILKKLHDCLEDQKAIYFLDFQNLKTKELSDLRKQLKREDALLYVAKKKLIDNVFQTKKIPVKTDKLEGQIALVFGLKDEIGPAKTIYDFQQKHNYPEILGGYLENELLSTEKVVLLAKLPSRDELFMKLINCLRSPSARFVNALEENIKGLLFVLKSIASKE